MVESAPATVFSQQPAFAEGCGGHEMPVPQKDSFQMGLEGFARSPSSRRASFAERGVQVARRSDCEAQHNAEIGFLPKPPLET
jgi:hypothetical protein